MRQRVTNTEHTRSLVKSNRNTPERAKEKNETEKLLFLFHWAPNGLRIRLRFTNINHIKKHIDSNTREAHVCMGHRILRFLT